MDGHTCQLHAIYVIMVDRTGVECRDWHIDKWSTQYSCEVIRDKQYSKCTPPLLLIRKAVIATAPLNIWAKADIYTSALQGHLTSRIDIYVNYALHKMDTLKERDGQGQAIHESKFAYSISMLYTELAGPIWICTYICRFEFPKTNLWIATFFYLILYFPCRQIYSECDRFTVNLYVIYMCVCQRSFLGCLQFLEEPN